MGKNTKLPRPTKVRPVSTGRRRSPERVHSQDEINRHIADLMAAAKRKRVDIADFESQFKQEMQELKGTDISEEQMAEYRQKLDRDRQKALRGKRKETLRKQAAAAVSSNSEDSDSDKRKKVKKKKRKKSRSTSPDTSDSDSSEAPKSKKKRKKKKKQHKSEETSDSDNSSSDSDSTSKKKKKHKKKKHKKSKNKSKDKPEEQSHEPEVIKTEAAAETIRVE